MSRPDKSNAVSTKPASLDENEEVERAERTVRAADRWLQAVLRDADRVFQPHRKRPRPT